MEIPHSLKEWLDVLTQVLLVIIPVVVTWFIRTYVRSSKVENDVAAIVRIANASIDYVENLDTRGELNLPPEFTKGAYKLKLATKWLESELNKNGISITNEQAEKWISSEFQKRTGEIHALSAIAEVTSAALDLVQGLERNKLIQLPADDDRVVALTKIATDWVIVQLANRGVSISREEALTWVRAELLKRLQATGSALPLDARLAALATRAMDFLDDLKKHGQLAIEADEATDNVERDLVAAWILTEAAKQNIPVNTKQIAQLVNLAFSQHNTAVVPATSG